MANPYIHAVVEERAKETPNAVALVDGNTRVTYGELNSRANTLARHLRSLGVRPDVPVGIFIERSVDLPIAALGVLKAGGAYLPLDPTYPARRLSILLEDSATPFVIAQRSAAEKLPSGQFRTIILEEVLEKAPQDPVTSNSEVELKPENLAYIIFTSGSTGRPKGVQISHANLMNLVEWHLRAFGVTSIDMATLQASPGFDAAVWETWPYLAAGASLYIVDEKFRITPHLLRNWIVQAGITIGFVPTVVAEELIELSWPQRIAFRFLLTGADTLRRRPPQGLPFALINNYGPTECTVVATSGKVREQMREKAHDSASAGHSTGSSTEFPSIGRAIDNVKTYVVDEKLERVPDGTPGELLIGGMGVARGYINSPALNAEKFIADTFGNKPGSRLYRTGDLVRALPDGEIAFMGRIDDQIKVMGHRIEPNEIVAILNRHPKIETSVVCHYSDSSGVQRLVGYVVFAVGVEPSPSDLREFLSSHLPVHMVPATFVRLEHLPMSAHGKLDRSALPQPTEENTLRDESVADYRSPIEEHLAAVLSSLLGISHVGSEDNFFTLGGHSLMGAQLIAKVKENFGVDLPLRTLFEEPTPRGMAIEIERLIHARLANMSEDEAQRLLASSGQEI